MPISKSSVFFLACNLALFNTVSLYVNGVGSRSKEQYETANWHLRDEIKAGHQNIINEPLVAEDKILLPPLHVKLGIYKDFLKALELCQICD